MNEINKRILRSGGGMGRIIAFSGVVQQYAKEHPDHQLRVMSSYPDVFSNLNFIDRHYPIPQPGQIMPDFYDSNKDFDLVESEPYLSLDYRQGRKHIIEIWCDKFGLKYPEKISGIVKLTKEENMYASSIKRQMNLGASKLIAFQPFGGTPFTQPDMAFDILRQRKSLDLSVECAQKIVDILGKKGYSILQISLNSEPQLTGTLKLPVQQNQVLSPRVLFALINQCDGLLAIDSFAQHLWASLNKSNALVLWGPSHPTNMGYKTNKNIINDGSCKTMHCNRPETYLYDQSGSGQPWVCPHGRKCMNFIPENIVDQLDKIMKENPNGNA